MNNKVNEIHSCEVCGNDNLIPVLNIGLHPMCDDLVPIGDNRICREYPIDILFCKTCLTAHQHFQVPKQDLFRSLNFPQKPLWEIDGYIEPYLPTKITLWSQEQIKNVLPNLRKIYKQ